MTNSILSKDRMPELCFDTLEAVLELVTTGAAPQPRKKNVRTLLDIKYNNNNTNLLLLTHSPSTMGGGRRGTAAAPSRALEGHGEERAAGKGHGEVGEEGHEKRADGPPRNRVGGALELAGEVAARDDAHEVGEEQDQQAEKGILGRAHLEHRSRVGVKGLR